MKLRTALLCSALVACSVHEALADSDTWILATGRRDPRMYAIDFEKALRPENATTTPPRRSSVISTAATSVRWASSC